MNATVAPHGALGYLTLWPAGGPMPLASTLNALDGALTSNAAIVPANAGAIGPYATHATDVILDLHGYFAP